MKIWKQGSHHKKDMTEEIEISYATLTLQTQRCVDTNPPIPLRNQHNTSSSLWSARRKQTDEPPKSTASQPDIWTTRLSATKTLEDYNDHGGVLPNLVRDKKDICCQTDHAERKKKKQHRRILAFTIFMVVAAMSNIGIWIPNWIQYNSKPSCAAGGWC